MKVWDRAGIKFPAPGFEKKDPAIWCSPVGNVSDCRYVSDCATRPSRILFVILKCFIFVFVMQSCLTSLLSSVLSLSDCRVRCGTSLY